MHVGRGERHVAQARHPEAACRLPELDSVLIARHEVAGRRHFDLAHELFHLLTWAAMPPERLEEARETGGNRVEQLANNFAAAVLIPADTVRICSRYTASRNRSRYEASWLGIAAPCSWTRM